MYLKHDQSMQKKQAISLMTNLKDHSNEEQHSKVSCDQQGDYSEN